MLFVLLEVNSQTKFEFYIFIESLQINRACALFSCLCNLSYMFILDFDRWSHFWVNTYLYYPQLNRIDLSNYKYMVYQAYPDWTKFERPVVKFEWKIEPPISGVRQCTLWCKTLEHPDYTNFMKSYKFTKKRQFKRFDSNSKTQILIV